MDFGDALLTLKAGSAVAREGWNGKGQRLELQVPDEHSKMTLPYIFIVTVQGDRVPWLASQSDMLADDWHAVGPVSNPGVEYWHGITSAVIGALEGHPGVTRAPGMLEHVARDAARAAFGALIGQR